MAKPEAEVREQITIKPPNFQTAQFTITGSAPLVINAFSSKSREEMRTAQEAGHRGKKGAAKPPKDFSAAYEAARHISTEGWDGFSAAALRAALISACRMVGFAMTRARLSVFVEPDGFDAIDNTPLVKITRGEPKYSELPVRNQTGVVDLRARPMWAPGWQAKPRLRWDGDQFSPGDVSNLLLRVGQQVGIGEGRPDSKNSCGMGWGLFLLESQVGEKK